MKNLLLIILFASSSNFIKAQDTLTMRSGENIIVKIIEVGSSEVKYKKIADTSLLKQTRKVKAQLDQLRCFEKKSIKTVANVSNLTKQVHDDIPESSVGEDSTCIVCMVDPKSHLAVPCGHQLACKECSTKLKVVYCKPSVGH